MGRRVMRVSSNPDLLTERNHDTLLNSSVTESHRSYCAEDSWNMGNPRISAELLFIVSRDVCFYRGVLWKYVLGT